MSEFDAVESAAVSLSRQQWKDTTALAGAIVALADLFAAAHDIPELPPQIEKLRLRAIQPSRAEQMEAVRAQMANDRLRALKASKQPFRDLRVGDGTQAPDTAPDDSWGARIAKDQMLAGGQAARHAAMGAGQYIDASDARPQTRPIREEIYRKLAEEAQK
jgi:hypothetical protein